MRSATLIGFIATAALGISAIGCAPETREEEFTERSSSIVGGRDDAGHLAVGLVQWDVTSANGTKGSSLCSSTLVAPTIVLTAAHCVVPATKGDKFDNYIVYFGNTPGKAKSAEVFNVVKTSPHPNYRPDVFGDYDIAVLTLDRDASTLVKPSKLARTMGNIVGVSVSHVGWGTSVSKSANEKSGSGAKRTVDLPVTGQEPLLIKTGNGKSGICNGDSGGPALVQIGTQDVVVGVHSYINNNTTCLGDGFSARVDRYVDFLSKFAPNSFVDVQNGGKGTKPPAPNADNDGAGGAAGQCCLNGACYQCPTKAALDKCVGIDLDACFDQCGNDPSCLLGCSKKLGDATHDPSACTKSGNGGNAPNDDEDDSDGDDGADDGNPGGQSCSVSVQCKNGVCRCGGLKAGATCDGKSGLPTSCDVVCRVCK